MHNDFLLSESKNYSFYSIHFWTIITKQNRTKSETKLRQKPDKLDKTRQNQEFNLYPLAVFSGKLFHDVRQKISYIIKK